MHMLETSWMKVTFTLKCVKVGQSMDCSSPHSVLEALLATRPESLLKWRGSYPYPQVQNAEQWSTYSEWTSKSWLNIMMSILLQNLLRNAAKSGCQTNYTYIPDIDMVPTPSMDLQLEQFLSTPEVHFLLTTVDLQCLPMSQGEGMRNVCLCGAHL